MKVEKLERVRFGYKVTLGDEVIQLEEETIVVFRIKKDLEIDSKLLKAILDADKVHVQKRKAIVHLEKPQSVHEFKTYLRSLNVKESNIEEWTNTYKKLGYLDDLEYGKLLVEGYKNKYGAKKIESILSTKGLHPETISRVLPKNDDALKKLVMKACKSIQKPTFLQAKNTVIRQVIAKGFDYETTLKYVEQYLDPKRFDESNAILKEYQKIRSKYEKTYQGYALKQKIHQALRQKGFSGQQIEQIGVEMENNYV
ncbi:RecX family transcriptional regulator [Acholeplasma vituli]|uniref:Regulatory protein RecX n=1 Tax=Paracholeplasma vituli TaxID=69473 RepID=A0ABT2PV12_9MOLU|nr:RecX family transcriptional regulator [Paracholeplasma vituli]MCU0104790.1 RecX family transcriptional regulator [Paracholeplasma vituli]